MTNVLYKFFHDPPNPYVNRGEGVYIITEDGRSILDATAGWCSQMILGYSNAAVITAMQEQLAIFSHMDHNVWRDRNLEELAALLVSEAPGELNKVYFCGNSGSEAIEAAIKLSYQAHHDEGKQKKYFISRAQSFHGATLQCIALSERDILDFYSPMYTDLSHRVPEHNPSKQIKDNGYADSYARVSADALEDKILELGPENVAGFVGETVLGALQGDVPPAASYWQMIKTICTKYDVHLILDEVYCGLGRSGRIYCCDWDAVEPDFVCFGKTLAAGYAPLSVVVTNSRIAHSLARGQGRIQHGHTHQGYSLGVAAALAVQKIVHSHKQLEHIRSIGSYMRTELSKKLGDHQFFGNIRGRGLMFSLEYHCPRQNEFGNAIFKKMRDEHDILVDAKWHRISFHPPYILTYDQAETIVTCVVETFLELSESWPVIAGA